MSVASYNRASALLRKGYDEASERRNGFARMDAWNAIPKQRGAPRPFGPVVFQYDPHHELWWMLDTEKREAGFGFYAPQLETLLAAYDVMITEYDLNTNILHGIPWPGNLPPWARRRGF